MRGVLGAEVLPELRGVQNYLQGKVLTRTKPEGRDTTRWEGSMESSRQSIGVNTRTQWMLHSEYIGVMMDGVTQSC